MAETSIDDTAPFSTATVVRRHHAALVRFLRRRGASHEDAHDIAQEAYVRLLRYEGSLDIESPSAMLFRIAANVATDHRRSAAQRRVERHVSGVEGDLASDQPSVERDVSAQQLVRAVRTVIDGLPPRCRSVFLMSRVDELTYGEIAARLSISLKAVEKHMSRALRACAEPMDAA